METISNSKDVPRSPHRLRNWLGTAMMGGCLMASATFAAPLPPCMVSDFTAGGSNADACANGPSANTNTTDVNNLGWGTDWTFGGKYENGSGVEAGSIIDLMISVTSDPGVFMWSIPNSQFKFEDAIFAVKQANPQAANPGGWVAYLFEPLPANSGKFRTSNSFAVDDYSHVSIYTRGTKVPEISASGAGIALALLSSLILFGRERRRNH